MPRKPLSEEQKQALRDRLAAGRAKAQANREQRSQSGNQPAPDVEQTTPPVHPNVSLSEEQFAKLISLLQNQTTDKSTPPSFAQGLQTNQAGQTVGTVIKYNPDASYYPNPVDRLMVEPRLSRFNLNENYHLTWDITAKPYETKFGTHIVEPTFHVTLYQIMYDDQGNDTGKYILIQTLHLNEDEGSVHDYVADTLGEEANVDMRDLMNQVRYERVKRWLFAIFFQEKTTFVGDFYSEEAIGGQVVRVITRSNVKGFGNKAPKIEVDELA